MANLRLKQVNVLSNTTLTVSFSDNLTPGLLVENVKITPQITSVPPVMVQSVVVSGSTLDILCLPLTPEIEYKIEFISTDLSKFKNVNGTAFLIEDGKNNASLIRSPQDSSNPFIKNMKALLREQIYDIDDGTIVSQAIESQAGLLNKALADIRQLKNENYLTKLVVDELKTRESGPFDRLDEEGAYQILRVGKRKSISPVLANITTVFSDSLISLQQENAEEDLTLSSTDTAGTFNINDFIVTLKHSPVIKLERLTFLYNDILGNGNSFFDYDISKLGYLALDDRYDTEHASKYLTLNSNQFKLSELLTEQQYFTLKNVAKVRVKYKYKNLGKIIDSSSVTVTKTVKTVREVIEPLLTIFNIKNSHIVTDAGISSVSNGVKFLDANEFPTLTKTHPAFSTELTFSFEALPTKIGEYSVDYVSGTVYVFGATSRNEGTGATPPLASYTYLRTFEPLIDYVYDESTYDVAPLPDRELVDLEAKISFTYEETLIPGQDFAAAVHEEALAERVQNRLLPTLNAVKVRNAPVTNVFRIFNETKGLVYTPVRWNQDVIYFNASTPPELKGATHERVSYHDQLNELLFILQELNVSGLRVLKIALQNNNIIAATEDCIGSSINTSVHFSDTNIFVKEMYFSQDINLTVNLNRFNTIGQYQIDYLNGIVYVVVSSAQTFDIGSVSYKLSQINPIYPHVINPVSLFYQRNIFDPKDKEFDYASFGEDSILPASFDVSDEQYHVLSGTRLPYQVVSGRIGAFVNAVLDPRVNNNISFIRGLFEYNDLQTNPDPINFSDSVTFSEKEIQLNSKVITSSKTVEQSGADLIVTVPLNLTVTPPNITVSYSVIRISDSAELWNGSGTVILGRPVKLKLPGINSPAVGDGVVVKATLTINDLSRIILDYNRGDQYIDYTYLADEIIISYEYGENQIDFRTSTALVEGDEYYVTYRVGALRDALLKNFGSLIDIPLLNVFDNTFDRERYRESIQAAFSSFIKGPTVEAMKQIVKIITHVVPDLDESVFENWSLGNSFLYPGPITTTGELKRVKGKYGNGILMDDPGQTISLPESSNLRLEEGTFSSWIIPQWDGIDNDAELTITIKKDGNIINPSEIFLGSGEYHPTLVSGNSFKVSKRGTDLEKISPLGLPNKNKPGVYIYLDRETNIRDGYEDGYDDGYARSSTFLRWFVDVVDALGTPSVSSYEIKIQTNGEYFDVKAWGDQDLNTTSITSGSNVIYFNIQNHPHQGITFVADQNHYVMDAGKDPNRNRISILKDPSGYLVFKVRDREGGTFQVSADVSQWKRNERHHVAASWILNSTNQQDELHLFIDGFETPNIIRYGERIPLDFGRKFRALNPEEITSILPRPVISGIDLVTTGGTSVVLAGQSFSAAAILPGDTLFIEESGFNQNGYTILAVSGNQLTLSGVMPASITQGQYCVNRTTIPVSTKIDAYKNIAVTLLHSYFSNTDGVVTNSEYIASSSTNFIIVGVEVGDLVRIETIGAAPHYVVTKVAAGYLKLNRPPPTGTSLLFYLYKDTDQEIPGIRAIIPYYRIERILANDGTLQPNLVLLNGGKQGDLVRIKSFGLNFRRNRQSYYCWSDTQNVLATRLPPPISLDDVKIFKILLASTVIGPDNSTVNLGSFVSSTILPDQPVLSDTGRTLQVNWSGSNVDWSVPVTITVSGMVGITPTSEILTFNSNTYLYTVNKYNSVQGISVTVKPIDLAIPAGVVAVRERYSITTAENSTLVPVIRFSYQVFLGTTLSGSGNTVTDPNGNFSSIDVGNYIQIFTAGPAGYYRVLSVTEDRKTAVVDGTISAFSGATYQILNVTTERSGLQNGFFTFERADQPKQPYALTKGQYEFDYESYIPIRMDPVHGNIYFGSDLNGKLQANAILDEIQIKSIIMTDTRIGEIGKESINGNITKQYNQVKQLSKTSTTLVLLHLDETTLSNAADYYVFRKHGVIQAGRSPNETFGQSLSLRDKPFIVQNDGILNTKTDGTIEFWVSPLIDTFKDPAYRFYFDATGIQTEETVSINSTTVKIKGTASNVLSVKPKNGLVMDYFTGGGTVQGNTIKLKRPLPRHEELCSVTYVPNGLKGDRLSIFKDPYGFLNFLVRANGTDYKIQVPIFWSQGTWHRVKAVWRFNQGKNIDQIRLFVDGFERGNILFGSGLLFGQNYVLGQSFVGGGNISANINFRDPINEFVVGSDHTGQFMAGCLLDNLRISNTARPTYLAFGESIDVHYNKNINAAYPVTTDLFTTYLLDQDSLLEKNTDFALLKNKDFGLFDFSLGIIDSFDIVRNSDRVREVLEALIKTLKPANSRVFISYK